MQSFFKHLQDPSPGFRCYKPSSSESKLEHNVKVAHALGGPASQEEIAVMRSKLGDGSEQFEPLYLQHNGMVLYAAGSDVGIMFYAIDELEDRNAEWRQWFENADEEDMWEFQKHGIAFGEIIASGNYFIFWEGKVFYSNHDDGDDNPYANSLANFLNRIAENPAQFLYDAGCYTRYGSEQWIPGEYVPEMC